MRKAAIALVTAAAAITALGQQSGSLPIPPNHPAIQYGKETDDRVAELNTKLKVGAAQLLFDKTFGYLPSVLKELNVAIESQIMVFSKTSLQSTFISPSNPRAIFFNDAVAVAWVRGGTVLEVAVHDPRQGMIFYTIEQAPQSQPLLTREQATCLGCHNTPSSLGVPGTVVRTVFPGESGVVVNGLIGAEVDHRTPFAERWGGWYVTGKQGPLFHRANATVAGIHENHGDRVATAVRHDPLPEKFSTTSYPAPYSDVVALSVFEHQMHMMNLITRMGWLARTSTSKRPVEEEAKAFVDYLLFVDEAPFTAALEDTSGFAAKFGGLGPFDSKGRSLRQLDLLTKLLRYTCSYMIYSDAFKALPDDARDVIYKRLWSILSGAEHDTNYGRLTLRQRREVVEILRDTVKDLPDYFNVVTE